jgi:hypothetical protein
MNRIKKAVFGVLVAGLAFGFSAFKTVKRQNILTYYKTDMNYPGISDRRGYNYYSGDRCESDGAICSAQWDIGTNAAPSEGDALPTIGIGFITGTTVTGHFE